jgi:hypothetical protein
VLLERDPHGVLVLILLLNLRKRPVSVASG